MPEQRPVPYEVCRERCGSLGARLDKLEDRLIQVEVNAVTSDTQMALIMQDQKYIKEMLDGLKTSIDSLLNQPADNAQIVKNTIISGITTLMVGTIGGGILWVIIQANT